MTGELRAVLRNGERVTLAAEQGSTEAELVAHLTRDALTGSAVPLASAMVKLDDGTEIPYGDIVRVARDLFP